MSMTKEQLQQQLTSLQSELEQTVILQHRITGAIQLVQKQIEMESNKQDDPWDWKMEVT